jgi:hypothetical protein
MCRSLTPQRRPAFSVFELIVVLAVFLALLGMFLPLVQRIRESAAETQSGNNLKQMTLAMHSCQDLFKKLPPAIGWFPVRAVIWGKPAPHGTAFYHILPFMDENNIYNDVTGFSANSRGKAIKTFLAPQDFTAPPGGLHFGNRGATSYAINGYALINYYDLVNQGYDSWGFTGRPKDGNDQSWMSLPKMTAQDGTSNTIAFGERFAVCQEPIVGKDGKVTGYRTFERVWGEDLQNYNNFSPAILRPVILRDKNKQQNQIMCVSVELMPQFNAAKTNCEPGTYQGFSPNVFQVSMYDGSTRRVSSGIALEIWSNLLFPDDGNVIGPQW